MTLAIIFIALVLVGVSLYVWEEKSLFWSHWRGTLGIVLITAFGISSLANLFFIFPCKAFNEKLYYQLVQEKKIIETVLINDERIGGLVLSEKIVDYNNRILEHRFNSKRFILKDYYSRDVNWKSLEIIELE